MRGVVATRAIAAEEPLVEIPRGRLVNAETALAGLAQRRMQAGVGVEQADEVAQLAAWLLVEDRDPGSGFLPYLETLPRDLRQFPILAAPEEVALLDGSLTGAMLEHQRAELAADHARLVGDAPWAAAIGFGEYAWARMCVMSRTFKLTIDGAEGR